MTNYNPIYPPPPAPPPAHAKKPRTKLKTALIVAGLLILGILIGSVGANGSGKAKTVAGPTVTAVVTARPTATVNVTTTPTVMKTIATRVKTRTVTYTPQPKTSFSDGTYLVGRDIKPGLYQTTGNGNCYWQRDRNLRGGLNSIIANDNIDGPTTVEVASSDMAFEVSGGCEWHNRVN